MKRNRTTTSGNDPMPQSQREKFLLDFLSKVNVGIHADLEHSADYIESHELDDYIDKGKGLNIDDLNANDDLSVEDVVEIAIHFARHVTHKNWHEVMDALAEEHGLNLNKPQIQVVTDPNELPKEVRDALRDAFGGDDDKPKRRRSKK